MPTLMALLAVSAVSLAFGSLHIIWFGHSPEKAQEVLLAYVAATLLVAVLFLLGQVLRVRNHAYYIIISGAAFLAVDAFVWWRFGIMPGPKHYQDGFVPAAIMGIFLGPLYRIIAPVP